MIKHLILLLGLFFILYGLSAQEETILLKEGFVRGVLPPGWSAKGASLNTTANIKTDFPEMNLLGDFGISFNTEGYFLQLPEIESCGSLRFSFQGSSSTSQLGFKVQKQISGSSKWEDVSVFMKPISGGRKISTIRVDEPRKVKLRILLHDRTKNTLYIDNIIATSYVDPNILYIQTDKNRIEFGNCICDSTILLFFHEPHDSIDLVELSILDDGFEIQSHVNLKEVKSIPIRFVGLIYRAYESVLQIKFQNKIKTIPISARRVSGKYMTLLSDFVYGEEHSNWTIKAFDNNSYYLLGSEPDSLYVSLGNLSNCKALQILADLRTYNGINQQYLSIQGLDNLGKWCSLGRITPKSDEFEMNELILTLEKEKYSALKFVRNGTLPTHKIGVKSITINGAFGDALSLTSIITPSLRIIYNPDSGIDVISDNKIGLIVIMDISGQIIFKKEIPSDIFSINLPKGIYIIRTENKVVKVAI